jgi:hypothetical protein
MHAHGNTERPVATEHAEPGVTEIRHRNRPGAPDIGTSMLSMRSLLQAEGSLPDEVRERIAGTTEEAHEALVGLGLNDCEAAELLDVPLGCGCD